MSTFTFTCYNEDTESSLTFSAEYLGDVLERFEQFLKGAGYHFEGNLDFVTFDSDDDYDDDYDDEEPPEGLVKVFQHNMSKTTDYSYPNTVTPTVTIGQIQALTTSDVAAFQVTGSGTIPGYGAVPPTMAPIQPLTPKDLDKWSL